MNKPRILDLCCKAGGASRGLADAGFDVTGVDIAPQPHYPYPFIQADALALDPAWIAAHFDAVWASWPCQAYTAMGNTQPGKLYPDLIAAGRALVRATGLPYIFENVIGAPLHNAVMLCGAMFDLKVYRHRLFESNVLLLVPPHSPHRDQTPRAGRGVSPKGFVSVAGKQFPTAYARQAMGIDWMTQRELAQAIPPAYSAYLGRQLAAAVGRVAA